MKVIDRCPNCFSFSRDKSDERDEDEVEYAEIQDEIPTKKKKKRNFLMPLAFLMLSLTDNKINDQRGFYSKFYTASCQPRVFCHGKKYKIERKHKVKKRDLLLGDKLSNNAISGNGKYFTMSPVATITSDDKINSEGERRVKWSEIFKPFNLTRQFVFI